MITALILLPLLGAIGIALLPAARARLATFLVQAGCVALVAGLCARFVPDVVGLQLVERRPWIPSLGAEYLLGLDGLSLLLVLLTTVILPFALCAHHQGSRGFFSLMLLLQAGLYGTFTAQNFVLWFLFYELSLLPSFLLIRLWGGEASERASTRFFLYTFLGSIAMLLGFLGVYYVGGTFEFAALPALGRSGLLEGPETWFIFAGIFLGLAVKVPIFPFHTWLPDAYAAAPTGVAMVLTGALSKMGVYGFIRLLLPLFPSQIQALGPWLMGLAVCSILFASLAAWAQTDLKRMVAYLSINHLGYCLLALFAVGAAGAGLAAESQAALSGVLVQMASHGITAAALFYYVGLLEQRRGRRGLADFGGLMQRAPIFSGWMSVAMFSSLGLPGLNGFIGEFLIFKGTFALAAPFAATAAFGLLITAVVFLRAMQALFSGPVPAGAETFPEMRRGEMAVVAPVTLLMFAIGLAPQFLLNIFNAAVVHLARILT